jgi:hypothetical protein
MHTTEQLHDGYRPGACNIGPEEIALRRRSGYVGLSAAGLLAVSLVAVGAPPVTRWLVAVPVAGAAAGFLQARLRFCAAYGFRGVRGLVGVGRPEIVEDAAARAADRRRSLLIFGASAGTGLAVAAALVTLPL